MNRTLRTRTILAAAAIALTAMSVALSVAGPAQAYDANSCVSSSGYASATIFAGDVDLPRMSSGSVDFGDGWHLGGSPQGDAVICWGTQLVIKGRLYADSPTPIVAAVDIRYFREDGSFSTSPRQKVFGKDGGSIAITQTSSQAASTSVNRVRIRLWNCGSANQDCNLVNAQTFNRGDPDPA